MRYIVKSLCVFMKRWYWNSFFLSVTAPLCVNFWGLKKTLCFQKIVFVSATVTLFDKNDTKLKLFLMPFQMGWNTFCYLQPFLSYRDLKIEFCKLYVCSKSRITQKRLEIAECAKRHSMRHLRQYLLANFHLQHFLYYVTITVLIKF